MWQWDITAKNKMKKIYNLLITICAVCLCSACNNDVKDPSKLTGTYWANESSLPGGTFMGTQIDRTYYYDVWHFTSENQAELIQYNTTYTQVDIGHGDDPAKYGYVYKDGCGYIHVTSYKYPKISVYETSPGLNGYMENKHYWDGEFVTPDLLIMNGSERFLRINR